MDNVAICAIGLLLFCGSLVTMHGEEGSDLMLRFHSEVYAATFEDISRKSYKEHMVFTVGVNKANELAHEFVLANKEEMIEWRNRHQLSSEAYNLTQQYITDRKTEKVELEGLTIDGMSDPENITRRGVRFLPRMELCHKYYIKFTEQIRAVSSITKQWLQCH